MNYDAETARRVFHQVMSGRGLEHQDALSLLTRVAELELLVGHYEMVLGSYQSLNPPRVEIDREDVKHYVDELQSGTRINFYPAIGPSQAERELFRRSQPRAYPLSDAEIDAIWKSIPEYLDDCRIEEEESQRRKSQFRRSDDSYLTDLPYGYGCEPDQEK